MLTATFTFPSSLQEAEQMKNDHEKLKKALEVSGSKSSGRSLALAFPGIG
jgi:hypothetical protein